MSELKLKGCMKHKLLIKKNFSASNVSFQGIIQLCMQTHKIRLGFNQVNTCKVLYNVISQLHEGVQCSQAYLNTCTLSYTFHLSQTVAIISYE